MLSKEKFALDIQKHMSDYHHSVSTCQNGTKEKCIPLLYTAETNQPISGETNNYVLNFYQAFKSPLESDLYNLDSLFDVTYLFLQPFSAIPITLAGLVTCFLLLLKLTINNSIFLKTIADHVYRTSLAGLHSLKKHCTGRAK